MPKTFLADISKSLNDIEGEGLYKRERQITSAQAATLGLPQE